MADRDLRDLERRYHEDGICALPALNAARQRMGLPRIRLKIIHYIKAYYHHRLGNDGLIDPRVERSAVHSACGVTEVWPRTHYPKRTQPSYTHEREQITCKTCLRVVNAPNFSEGKPQLHMSLKTLSGLRAICGGRHGVSTEILEEVGCRGCLRRLRGEPRVRTVRPLNARGRRRLHRQQQFPFKYGIPTGSQSDPFRHGMA